MKYLLFLMLFALPIAVMAQSSESQAHKTHQQAEALFLAQNPNLQKVDLEKLAEKQKDEHKACATCGFQKENLNANTNNLPITAERLVALKNNQEKLIADTKELINSGAK